MAWHALPLTGAPLAEPTSEQASFSQFSLCLALIGGQACVESSIGQRGKPSLACRDPPFRGACACRVSPLVLTDTSSAAEKCNTAPGPLKTDLPSQEAPTRTGRCDL